MYLLNIKWVINDEQNSQTRTFDNYSDAYDLYLQKVKDVSFALCMANTGSCCITLEEGMDVFRKFEAKAD